MILQRSFYKLVQYVVAKLYDLNVLGQLIEVRVRGDQQPEQEPELDPEFSYLGRSLSRSRSGKFFKKPDQEPERELCYGSFSFKLSFAYVRKIEQNSI